MVNSLERMKELVAILNEAGKIYYQGRDEIMSNLEYDRLYDELASLEKEENIILAGSPTGRVGYEVVSALPKERHGHPVLSLDKTKDVETLRSWLGENDGQLTKMLLFLQIIM